MFDWIPLIGDWSLTWQSLVLSIAITVPCLFLLVRVRQSFASKLGRNNNMSTKVVPILALLTILVGLTLYTTAVVSGVVIPGLDLTIGWQVITFACAGALLLIPPFFVYGLEEEHRTFTNLFGTHYHLLSQIFRVIVMTIVLSLLLLVISSIVSGIGVIAAALLGLSDMGLIAVFAITLFATWLFLIGAFLI